MKVIFDIPYYNCFANSGKYIKYLKCFANSGEYNVNSLVVIS